MDYEYVISTLPFNKSNMYKTSSDLTCPDLTCTKLAIRLF